MEHKQAIAFEIALQTHVLQTCPVHNEIFYDDDVDPSSAFALAVELVRQHTPYVGEFHDDAHALDGLAERDHQFGPAQLSSLPECHGREERGAGDATVDLSAGDGRRVAQGLLEHGQVVGLRQEEDVGSMRTQSKFELVRAVTGSNDHREFRVLLG